MWSKLTDTEQAKEHCATDECYGRPMHRFEHGGVGSVYCSECKAAIEAYCAQLQGPGRLVPPHGSGPDNQ